jgi:hypothetical protein
VKRYTILVEEAAADARRRYGSFLEKTPNLGNFSFGILEPKHGKSDRCHIRPGEQAVSATSAAKENRLLCSASMLLKMGEFKRRWNESVAVMRMLRTSP